jgi:hypothetical protein
MAQNRYFVGQDALYGNWYVVPEMYREEFETWNLLPMGVRGPDKPFYAAPITSPDQITFENVKFRPKGLG